MKQTIDIIFWTLKQALSYRRMMIKMTASILYLIGDDLSPKERREMKNNYKIVSRKAILTLN